MTFKQIYHRIRINLLYNLGTKLGLIEDFPEDLWKKLENYYYCGNPVSVLLSINHFQGKCDDGAYALTMAFDKCNFIMRLFT